MSITNQYATLAHVVVTQTMQQAAHTSDHTAFMLMDSTRWAGSSSQLNGQALHQPARQAHGSIPQQ